jgi:DNA-binding response OmpR family regulator
VPTILLIGDDGPTSRHLRLALAKTAPQFCFGVVRSREELQAVRPPSVILLDLTLSHEPPFDLLRWLRTQQQFEHTPVFALGAAGKNDDIERAYALGANSCLLKTPAADGLDSIARGLAGYVGLVASPDCISGCC